MAPRQLKSDTALELAMIRFVGSFVFNEILVLRVQRKSTQLGEDPNVCELLIHKMSELRNERPTVHVLPTAVEVFAMSCVTYVGI